MPGSEPAERTRRKGRRAPKSARRRASFPAFCLAAFLAACAAGRMPPGPGPTEPRLTDEYLITPDGMELALRSWLPDSEPKAVLLALHGFNDYSRAFEAPGSWWAARGIATYAYDQRGFGDAPHRGLWAGTEVLAQDVTTAARLLGARHPGKPLFLLGDSMGGAVILVAMAAPDPPRVDGVVLAAPAVWARSEMPLYMRAVLWIAARTIPWAKVTGEGLDIQASDNIERLREMGRDPLVVKDTRVAAIDGLTNLMDVALESGRRLRTTSLLLYGDKDEVIPRKPTFRFWRNLPDGPGRRQRPALYENGWHLLLQDLGAEQVLSDIAAWIADPDAPLPSGADLRALNALAEGEARGQSPTSRPLRGQAQWAR